MSTSTEVILGHVFEETIYDIAQKALLKIRSSVALVSEQELLLPEWRAIYP